MCEVTLGTRVVSSNVEEAFEVQHPRAASRPFTFSPQQPGASGGDIMEVLCSEVLANEGIPLMSLDRVGWPVWLSQFGEDMRTVVGRHSDRLSASDYLVRVLDEDRLSGRKLFPPELAGKTW